MRSEWKGNIKKQGASNLFSVKEMDKKRLMEAAKRRLDAKSGKK